MENYRKYLGKLHANRPETGEHQSLARTRIVILPAWLEGDLRTDHAGETGAVWIYHGILSVSRNPIVREFAQRHLKTEKRHLYEIGSVLKRTRRSRLLPVWRIAGFITGAVPALIGSRWVFYTIEAVETFVDAHYELQIRRLEAIRNLDPDMAAVRTILEACRADEIAHRDEALQIATKRPGLLAQLWCALVSLGSRIAVACARRI